MGIRQADLADKLGMHRVSLGDWEKSEEVDAVRAARYLRALRELVEAAVAPVEATS